MDTMKDTKMQPATDVAIVPEATAEFIAGLLERIEQLESDLATAEQDSMQKQARIERLEEEECEQAALLDCLNEWKALAKSAERERNDLLEACKTFVEWLGREESGFGSAGNKRDTPAGERAWRDWYNENLRLCALAQKQARAAIATVTGESK